MRKQVYRRSISRAVRALSTLSLMLAPTISAAPAQATGPATHNISSCAALNTLGANNSVAADTIKLTADIDCTGVTFSPMFSSGFSGLFDGQGHRISHFTISNPGGNSN